MCRALSILLLAYFVTGCMESDDPPTSERRPLFGREEVVVPPESDRGFTAGERIGLITPGMPMATVEHLYGSGSINAMDLPAGEGTTVAGYVLLPGTYDELFIELGPDKQPQRARFHNPRSNWHDAATGLTIGTEFHELREMNGAPFSFTGFGWEGGGTITDWKGGNLEEIQVRLTYAPERIVGGGLPDTLLGDRLLSSDSSSVQGLGLTVREIIVPLRNPADSTATE